MTSSPETPQSPSADSSEEAPASQSDKRKQSLYFPESMLEEIHQEAARLERSLSWIVQRAWKTARPDIRKLPSSRGADDGEADGG
ncbi:MAG: TIGR04563 family protein [Deltaproteobacteria bacterium]